MRISNEKENTMAETTTATATAPPHPHRDRLDRILFSLNKTAAAYASKGSGSSQNEADAQTAGDLLRSSLVVFSQATEGMSNPSADPACYWDAARGVWVCPGNADY